MNRKVVLDTETTGFNENTPDNSMRHKGVAYKHRVIEIAALEMIDDTLTGRKFHTYLNPGDTKIDEGAMKIHGITDDFLRDKPSFRNIVDEFLDFVLGCTMVAHRASFDLEFLSEELWIADYKVPMERFLNPGKKFICTRDMSGGLSLDKLCAKYGIDTSGRKFHGALIDVDLTAQCYCAMIGKGNGPSVLRSSVNMVMEDYWSKYAVKEEGALIQEIWNKLEGIA